MISRLQGTLLSRGETAVEIATSAGVVYEVQVPLSVAERLPRVGEPVELRTLQVVREDSVDLCGFVDANERKLFEALLTVSRVGVKVALAALSTYSAPRLARAIADKEIAALAQIPTVGKKTAERIALELADRVEQMGIAGEAAAADGQGGPREAVQALVALGMSFQDADRAVRTAMGDDSDVDTQELIRRALSAT